MKKTFKYLLLIVLLLGVAGLVFAAGPDTVVYVSKTGEKYHTESCSSLKKSKIAISLGKAVLKYQPCKLCDPPVLDK
jgi:hypothetical protein